MLRASILKPVVISLMFVSVLGSSVLFADVPNSSNSTPEQVVTTVFDAFKNGDFTKFSNNIVNRLPNSNDELEQQFYNEQNEDPVTGYNVKSLLKINATTYLLKLDVIHRDMGISPDELTVLKQQDNTWKVVFEPRVTNAINGSPDYGKVTKVVESLDITNK